MHKEYLYSKTISRPRGVQLSYYLFLFRNLKIRLELFGVMTYKYSGEF